MREDYFRWLMDRVDFRRRGYDTLMRELYSIPFVTHLYRDENRVADANALYLEYTGLDIPREVSVLEILVSLAIRIDSEYIGDPSEPDPEGIFWEMCCNLGLERYTNKRFNREAVDAIIDCWISRDFDYDGEGSVFPLKHPTTDQRDVELWVQAQGYLSENYS